MSRRVIAATNRVAAVDFALRRPGRFDWEIDMPLPDATERLAIFREYTRDLKLLENVDLAYLARVCRGYTGADIKALCRESLLIAMDDTPHKVLYSLCFSCGCHNCHCKSGIVITFADHA